MLFAYWVICFLKECPIGVADRALTSENSGPAIKVRRHYTLLEESIIRWFPLLCTSKLLMREVEDPY